MNSPIFGYCRSEHANCPRLFAVWISEACSHQAHNSERSLLGDNVAFCVLREKKVKMAFPFSTNSHFAIRNGEILLQNNISENKQNEGLMKHVYHTDGQVSSFTSITSMHLSEYLISSAHSLSFGYLCDSVSTNRCTFRNLRLMQDFKTSTHVSGQSQWKECFFFLSTRKKNTMALISFEAAPINRMRRKALLNSWGEGVCCPRQQWRVCWLKLLRLLGEGCGSKTQLMQLFLWWKFLVTIAGFYAGVFSFVLKPRAPPEKQLVKAAYLSHHAILVVVIIIVISVSIDII